MPFATMAFVAAGATVTGPIALAYIGVSAIVLGGMLFMGRNDKSETEDKGDN